MVHKTRINCIPISATYGKNKIPSTRILFFTGRGRRRRIQQTPSGYRCCCRLAPSPGHLFPATPFPIWIVSQRRDVLWCHRTGGESRLIQRMRKLGNPFLVLGGIGKDGDVLRAHHKRWRRGKSPATKLSYFPGRSKHSMYAFAPVKARCLACGDCSDAGRLAFCESIINGR